MVHARTAVRLRKSRAGSKHSSNAYDDDAATSYVMRHAGAPSLLSCHFGSAVNLKHASNPPASVFLEKPAIRTIFGSQSRAVTFVRRVSSHPGLPCSCPLAEGAGPAEFEIHFELCRRHPLHLGLSRKWGLIHSTLDTVPETVNVCNVELRLNGMVSRADQPKPTQGIHKALPTKDGCF